MRLGRIFAAQDQIILIAMHVSYDEDKCAEQLNMSGKYVLNSVICLAYKVCNNNYVDRSGILNSK